MRAVFQRLLVLTRPRTLMSLALLLGLIASYAVDETSAERRDVMFWAPSVFESGTVDIAGHLDPALASTLPSQTAFKWDSSGAGTDCASVLPAPTYPSQ